MSLKLFVLLALLVSVSANRDLLQGEYIFVNLVLMALRASSRVFFSLSSESKESNSKLVPVDALTSILVVGINYSS